jgi:hypothetical protein
VFDGYYGNPALVIADAIDHAVITAASAVKAFQAKLQGLPYAVRACGKGAVQELDYRGCHFLRELGQRAAGRMGPSGREPVAH